jgi:hypothetical protein
MHIMEHRAVLADPDFRRDRELVELVLNHVGEHLEFLRNTDPALLQLIGEQPVPPLEQSLGQGQPPAGPQMPSASSISGSPIPEQMSPVSGQTVPGEQIVGPGVENVSMPAPAKPAGPFENLPVSAAELSPPTIG